MSYDPVKEKFYLGHFPASLWENKKIFQKDCKKLKVSEKQSFLIDLKPHTSR